MAGRRPDPGVRRRRRVGDPAGGRAGRGGAGRGGGRAAGGPAGAPLATVDPRRGRGRGRA
ncbi:MAG: hypothetical protein FJX36_14920 [Alphaproteobacteria bacterium]|nr:hypothetical protein [Alphaproteobacteria bacterium]